MFNIKWVQVIVTSVALLAAMSIAVACSSAQTSPTPVPPATAAPPIAPTAVAQPTSTPIPQATTTAVATPTPTRVLPTATPANQSTPQYGGDLRWGGLTSIYSLDPIHIAYISERPIHYAIYNTLVELGPDFSINPSVAQSWDISSDGKSVTFHLRQGIKFTDGTDLDANAVKFNFDRILDPNNNASKHSLFPSWLDSVVVNDKYTVTINMKIPYRPVFSILGDISNDSGIASPTAITKNNGDLGDKPIGSGPYELKEWLPDNRMVLVPNKNYWEKGPPYLDQITAPFIPDPSTQVAMLRTGNLDLQDRLTAADVTVLKGDPNVKVASYASCRFNALQVQVDIAPWNNKDLRQGLAYSLDRPTLVKVLLDGQGRPAYSPEGDCFWWSDPAIQTYKYDLTKAKQLIAQAGYPNGIDVDFWTQATSDGTQMASVYQAMLANAGIRTNIKPVPSQDWGKFELNRSMSLYPTNWVPRADPNGRLSILFHTNGSVNLMNYSNPQVDQLLDQAVGIYDQAKAKVLYDQAQQMIVQDVGGMAFTYFATEFTGMSVNVQNYADYPDRVIRFKNIWMEQ